MEGTSGADGTVTVTTRNVRRLSLLLRPELVSLSRPVRVVLNGREVFNATLTESCTLFEQSLRRVADPYPGWSAEIPLDVR